MQDKKALLDKAARDQEERLLFSRLLDQAERCARRQTPTHSFFLSPGERSAAESLLRAAHAPRHIFAGGYGEAERTVCLFLPDWMEEAETELPFMLLRGRFYAEEPPGHRDVLGSLMGLGLSREKLGDILISEGFVDLIILPEAADLLLMNWESAGRIRLKTELLPLSELVVPQKELRRIQDTVAAPRLDAVLGVGFSLSRGKAAELIAAGRVQLNYRDCLKGDKPVGEGDTISCRGLGKCRVAELGGLSKKGRLRITVERYV
ncbi:MAG: RNA-binding protein [Oscillospiraceae bacterium]|nr:RNA-binding protein [Oscillospiraceae bacterium]